MKPPLGWFGSPQTSALALLLAIDLSPAVLSADALPTSDRVAQADTTPPRPTRPARPAGRTAGVRAEGYAVWPLVPGDVVDIVVQDEPLWSGQFTLDGEGNLTLPHIGAIQASGLTIAQLADEIAEPLEKYVQEPLVTVNMAGGMPRRVSALGGVLYPNTYDLAEAPTLLALLAVSGGVAPDGDLSKAVLVRDGEPIRLTLQPGDDAIPVDMPLRPNDALHVPQLKSGAVFVIGAVATPGVISVAEASDAARAVVLMGGPTAEADLRRAYIVRDGVRVDADLGAILAPEPGEPAPEEGYSVRPGDVLVVPAKYETSVVVVGGVTTPGPQPHDDANRASNAVAMAGGATPAGSLAGAYVLRAGQRIAVDLSQVLEKGNAEADVLLEPGDVVVVPEVPSQFYVAGAVVTPGPYDLEQAATVMQAVTLSGGLLPEADAWNAYLVREGQTEKVDLNALMEDGDVTQDRDLRAGDTIMVPLLTEMVYVMGAVTTPGPQPIRPGDRLIDILGRAGGVSALGNAKAIMVYRADTLQPGDARVQLINLRTGLTKEQLREVVKAAKAGDEAEILDGEDAYNAQDGDVIMVPGRALGGQPNYLVEALRSLLLIGVARR